MESYNNLFKLVSAKLMSDEVKFGSVRILFGTLYFNMGPMITDKGPKADPEKVEAILELPNLVQYFLKFIHFFYVPLPQRSLGIEPYFDNFFSCV